MGFELAEITKQLTKITSSLAKLNSRIVRLETRHATLRQDHLRLKADNREMPEILESYREQIAATSEMITMVSLAQQQHLQHHAEGMFDDHLETESRE